MSHGLREVAGCHEEDVYVVNGQYLVQVVDCLDVLYKDYYKRLVICLVDIVGVAVALPAAEHSAMPDGRELGGVHDRARIFGGVDMRNDYSLRADVECAINDAGVVAVHTHNGCHIPEVAGSRQVRDVGEVVGTVLSLDPNRVEAELSQEIYDVSRV